MILKLYGIDGREKATYELKDAEHIVIQPKPLFTLERIVVNPPEQQTLPVSNTGQSQESSRP